jgi:UDP-2,3-diacylglucosamine pyrophosphatase LpxH
MDSFQNLAVVSDLHLGGPNGHQIFHSGDLLARGIADVALRKGPIGLVLNGDVVDFLAEENATLFDPIGAPWRLGRIIDDPAFSMIFGALARFCLSDNRILVVVLGNHDAEMALPEVQELLLRRLSSDALDTSWRNAVIRDDVRGRVRFATQGYGYRCMVNDKSVYCFHGDIADGWNAIDYSGIAKTQHDILRGTGQRSPAIPPGTQLVVNQLNQVKRELPFADLVKPEFDVASILVSVIRPDFARLIPPISTLAAKAKLRAAAGTEYLGQEDDWTMLDGHGDLPSAEELALFVEGQFERDPLELLDDQNSTLLMKEAITNFARRYVSARIHKDWGLCTTDEPMKWAETKAIHADLVIAGHTHMRKLKERSSGGWYVNSGTWIDLIHLQQTDVDTTESFARLCQRLNTRNLADLRNTGTLVRARPTWVYVEASEPGASFRIEDPTGYDGLAEGDIPPKEGIPL